MYFPTVPVCYISDLFLCYLDHRLWITRPSSCSKFFFLSWRPLKAKLRIYNIIKLKLPVSWQLIFQLYANSSLEIPILFNISFNFITTIFIRNQYLPPKRLGFKVSLTESIPKYARSLIDTGKKRRGETGVSDWQWKHGHWQCLLM